MRSSRVVRVSDSSEVASARRAAVECAAELRLGETATAKAALIVTELATNLIKHGDGGSILLGADDVGPPSLVITALDKGRGIASLAAAMNDGFSTAGSQGTGLGAIERAGSFFDVYTQPDRGTAIVCRVGDDGSHPAPMTAPNRIVIGGVCIAKPPEEESGDSWDVVASRDVVTVWVVDGLGHGPAAATAANAAVRVFREGEAHDLERMLQDAHAALRPTRGAAVGIARIFAAHGRVEFAGVGNIAGAIASDDGVRRVVSQNGIVGHEMRKVQTFSYPWSASSVLVLQSDGVSANWNAAQYAGLMQRDPTLIAAVLYRDHGRGTDDATVVVAKAS